jgi:hypothetical protein
MLRISISELPARARPLNAAELAKVFGGECKSSGSCEIGDEICSCYKCTFGVVSKAC